MEAAESRVTTSEALEKLARDQHAQGLATAVDVVRAQVQLARDQQNLLVARNAYQTSLLALARFLGLSPGTPLELAEPLEIPPCRCPRRGPGAARGARGACRLLAHFSISATPSIEQLKASRARYLPKLCGQR